MRGDFEELEARYDDTGNDNYDVRKKDDHGPHLLEKLSPLDKRFSSF